MNQRKTLHAGTLTVLMHTIAYRCAMPEANSHLADHTEGIQTLERHIRAEAEEMIPTGADCGAFGYLFGDPEGEHASVCCTWEITRNAGATMTLAITDKAGRHVDTIMLATLEDVRTFVSLIANQSVTTAERNVRNATESMNAIVAAGNHLIKKARKGEQ